MIVSSIAPWHNFRGRRCPGRTPRPRAASRSWPEALSGWREELSYSKPMRCCPFSVPEIHSVCHPVVLLYGIWVFTLLAEAALRPLMFFSALRPPMIFGALRLILRSHFSRQRQWFLPRRSSERRKARKDGDRVVFQTGSHLFYYALIGERLMTNVVSSLG